jgi:hypothetical protein
MGLPGSPMAGMSPRLSLPGNTGSLRGTSQRCGEENSVLAGYASLLLSLMMWSKAVLLMSRPTVVLGAVAAI